MKITMKMNSSNAQQPHQQQRGQSMSLLQNSNNKYNQQQNAFNNAANEQQQHHPSSNTQIIVANSSQQQRARSTNSKPGSAQASQVPSGQKTAHLQTHHAQNSTQSPWTPERSQHVLVKSTSQLQKKAIFGMGVTQAGGGNGSLTQRTQSRTVDASPDATRPNSSHHHQNSSASRTKQANASSGTTNQSQNTSAFHQLASKVVSNSSKASAAVNGSSGSQQLSTRNQPSRGTNQTTSASQRSSSASFANSLLHQQAVQRGVAVPTKQLTDGAFKNMTAGPGPVQVQTPQSEQEQVQLAQATEKITLLKTENKKLMKIMRNSEKLFYEKLKESKRESENLSAIFKQLWPLIKHKVKDPNTLLKTIVGGGSTSGETITDIDGDQASKLDELRKETETLKAQVTQLEKELKAERESRRTLEIQWHRQQLKIQEMRAFQQTVQTHTTASSAGKRAAVQNDQRQAADSHIAKENMPVPSFLKALYISSWDTIFDDDYADQQIVSLSAGHSNATSRNANSSTNNNSRGNFRSPNNILASQRNQNSDQQQSTQQLQSTSLSAPEALKLRMHELTARSKSALGLTPSATSPDYNPASGPLQQQSPNFNNGSGQQQQLMSKSAKLNIAVLKSSDRSMREKQSTASQQQATLALQQQVNQMNNAGNTNVLQYQKKPPRDRSHQPVYNNAGLIVQAQNVSKQQAQGGTGAGELHNKKKHFNLFGGTGINQ